MTQIDPFLIAVGTLGTFVFIITSMVGMGFSVTIPQIIAPLRNTRLVLLSLAANFILVPILALLIVRLLPLSTGLQIGLVLCGMAAGAPFLPKLVQVAKGDLAFTLGLMVLLMVVSVFFMPIVLPFVLTGVQVSPWEIAKSLVLLMLIPLGIAMFIRTRYEDVAKGLLPTMIMAANLSLVVLFIGYFVPYFNDIVGILGAGGIRRSFSHRGAVAAGICWAAGMDAGRSPWGTVSETCVSFAVATNSRTTVVLIEILLYRC
jgi:BASS family bile acid:Na+ symporter